MSDSPPSPHGSRDTDSGDNTSTRGWVKVSGIIAIVLVLLFVIMHLVSGGFRHFTPGGHASPSSVTEHGAQQP